jgi:hypothetical protein
MKIFFALISFYLLCAKANGQGVSDGYIYPRVDFGTLLQLAGTLNGKTIVADSENDLKLSLLLSFPANLPPRMY